jgi:sigma-B regulation protein RsbU (phosphoserine phosphatase)
VRVGTISVAGESAPCYEVGGDYLDVIPLDPHHLLIALGDVSGKGIPAAILMASAAAGMRALARGEALQAPGGLVRLGEQLNELLLRTTAKSRFLSVIVLVLDTETGIGRAINAGHCPGVIINRNADVPTRSIGASTMPLGIFPETTLIEEDVRLEPDDAILFFTDGIGERFEKRPAEQVLTEWVAPLLPSDSDPIRLAIMERLKGLTASSAPSDDMTLVCVTRRSDPAAS